MDRCARTSHGGAEASQRRNGFCRTDKVALPKAAGASAFIAETNRSQTKNLTRFPFIGGGSRNLSPFAPTPPETRSGNGSNLSGPLLPRQRLRGFCPSQPRCTRYQAIRTITREQGEAVIEAMAAPVKVHRDKSVRKPFRALNP